MAYRGPIVSPANYGKQRLGYYQRLGALRRARLRGMGALGQPPGYSAASDILNQAEGYGPSQDAGFSVGEQALLASQTPQSSGAIPAQGPTPAALQNLITGMSPPSDPLSFVSPQAAIAAGLDPTTTYNAWVQAMAQFPTQSAALAAGVPAGVITQLWQQSRSMVTAPAAPNWLAQNWMWLAGGAAILLVAAGGKR
jgi:hypothetical protein